MTEIKIIRDVEEMLTLQIEDEPLEGAAWEISEEFRNALMKELKAHLGGEFDMIITTAIQLLE